MADLPPIRVIHAVNRMDRGGIETFLMRVYRSIDRKKVQFDFLVHRNGEGVYDKEIEEMGGKIYKIGFSYNPFHLNKYQKKLRAFLFSHREYVAVHSHLNAFNGIVLRTAHKSGVKNRIAHIHAKSSGSKFREPIWNMVKLLGRSSFTERYACSVDAGRWAYGNNEEFSVVKNGIPLSKFKFNQEYRKQLREKYPLNGRICLGHIGAFRESKNHEFLLELMFFLKKESADKFVLFLVGTGPNIESVKKRAVNLGLEADVVFVGDVPDPERYYSFFDIFCLPSINEGLGIVAIEAQASGLPCIFSTGVPKEVMVTHFSSQISVLKKSSIEEWAKKINKYLSVTPGRSLMLTRGLGEFDISITAKKLQDYYIKTYNVRGSA